MDAPRLARNASIVFVAVALAVWAVLQFTPVGAVVAGRADQGGITLPSFPSATPAPEPPKFKEITPLAVPQRVIVLMYHDVVAARGPGTVWYDETSAGLRETLQFIKDNGGTVISLDQLHRHLTEAAPIPDRSVVITFDDNYQGVGDYAAPVLDEFQAPFTVFVHTDFVGVKDKGRPKMTWDQLKTLRDEYRATIGSHTASHPEDITQLTPEQQREELVTSMKAIEQGMGERPTSIAWANGKFDEVTLGYAEAVGYQIGLAMDSGMAEASRSILAVRRYPFNKFKQGWEAREAMLARAVPLTQTEWKEGPVRVERWERGRARYVAAIGGRAVTGMADGRSQVSDFVTELGGVAGINGAFFALAAIASDDNQMIGPVLCENREGLIAGYTQSDPDKLRDRPLVVWGPQRVAFVPYQPESMNTERVLRDFMPDLTDVFLGGAWLVRDGVPMTREQVLELGPKDAMDYRRRVLFGVTRDGEPICLAALGSVSSADLAAVAADNGVQNAVLLDSGFSTSLVVDGAVLASGHATRDRQSRPVPHAIVLRGTLTDPSQAVPTEDALPEPPRRRR